jgi:hypothetical protein
MRTGAPTGASSEADSRPDREAAPEKTLPCGDCGEQFRNPQGLAGHRRLAHSTSTARTLDERKRALDEQSRAVTAKERTAQQREADAARVGEAARRKESELLLREEAVREAESIPEQDRVRGTARNQIATLPEVTTQTILRIRGVDYRIENDRLIHLYWPKGERTTFEDGQWFQFGGRAYRVHDGKLRAIPTSTILARVLGEEG